MCSRMSVCRAWQARRPAGLPVGPVTGAPTLCSSARCMAARRAAAPQPAQRRGAAQPVTACAPSHVSPTPYSYCTHAGSGQERDAGVRARAQDKSKRELVDLKNQADSLAYQSEKQLKDAPADKLPADVKSKARARAPPRAAGGGGGVHGGGAGSQGTAPSCRFWAGVARLVSCGSACRGPSPFAHLTDCPGCDVLRPMQCERAAAGLFPHRARAVMLRPVSLGRSGVGWG